MWVLQRLGQLDDEPLALAARRTADRELRVHALKVLLERAELPGPLLGTWRLARLKDGDPFVRRAAAEALGRHPAPENIQPLLALRQSTPADDTHLVHVARMAFGTSFGRPMRGGSWKASA